MHLIASRTQCLLLFKRQLVEWAIVDTVAHALVSGTDAVAVGLHRNVQTFVEDQVAFSAAVEGLLACVLFPFEKGTWGIATQYWEALVAQIFMYILRKKNKYRYLECFSPTGKIDSWNAIRLIFQSLDGVLSECNIFKLELLGRSAPHFEH